MFPYKAKNQIHKISKKKKYEISGSHGGEYEDGSFLVYISV
jgi:hypothetical protein